MNIIKQKKIGGLFLILLLILSSCSIENTDFQLDNPTNEAVKITLDKKEYVVEPNTFTSVKLAPGLHNIVLPDNKSVDFIVYQDNKGGLINITNSKYVKIQEVYIVDDTKKSGFMPPENTITINNVSFTGSFFLFDGFFIDRNINEWRYDVGTPFPETVSVYDEKNNGKFVSKLFRQQEFLDYYENFYEEEKGYYEKHKVVNTERATNIFDTGAKIDQTPFENPEVQQYIKDFVGLEKEYRQTIDPKKQEELMGKFLGLYSKIGGLSQKVSSSDNYNPKEYERFTNTVMILSYSMAAGLHTKI